MIDARGRSCPEPVIMIKKAMETKAASYEMLVDSRVSVENVTRFATNSGYQVEVHPADEDEYRLVLTKQ